MIPLYIFKGKKEMSSVFLKIATYFKSFQQIQFASTYILDFSYSQDYYKNIYKLLPRNWDFKVCLIVMLKTFTKISS